MKGSKIIFILLFINLLLMYLSFTTHVEMPYEKIMFLLNIPLVIILFIVRENILEFFKYMIYLVLMTVVYNYIKPYITYRGEAYLERQVFMQKYKNACMNSIGNENNLKKNMKLWEMEFMKDENSSLDFWLNEFKVILFFIDSNNKIDIDIQVDENMSALKKMNISLKMVGTQHNVERAIKDILTLKKEERDLYKRENICYLSQKSELMEVIKKEDYEKKEVQKFLFETCEGY